MKELFLRALIGGVVVSAFAMLGDLFQPKRFAGLFGAAPSVALASLGLTIASKGKPYTAMEARSMVGGAVAFFVYVYFVSLIMMRYRPSGMAATASLLSLWFVVTFGLWFFWLR